MAFTQIATTCQSGALSGTETVAAGVTSKTVSVSAKTAAYEIAPSTNWNTTIWITGITTTQFVANFGTPAPDDGSGRLYWNLTDL